MIRDNTDDKEDTSEDDDKVLHLWLIRQLIEWNDIKGWIVEKYM